ncbi:MAG: tetratricopeptide (TPR) repeat protein [Granulosicoccus sp.]|jgi:tetratricopeptide (TPR) repeat protein
MTAKEQCLTGIARSVRCHSDSMEYIDSAIAADDSYALARLVKAWMLQSGRENSVSETVVRLIVEVEDRLPSHNGYEAQLLSALKLSKAGKSVESATVLEQMLLESPTDVYVHKIVQDEIFWLGKAHWMRDITERAAPFWQESSVDYGPFLSYRAFANEEAGYLDEAERFGRAALEIDPSDIWGAHAVAHTLLMKGESRRGLDWLEELSVHWGHGNQMRHHLWWHVCLFLLELGDHERILDLLTSEVRNPESVLVKESPAAAIDIQNFASLLLRLEFYGVDVGLHWNTLADVCASRVNNHGNAFGNVHDMMVLTATGQFDKASQLIASMSAQYTAEQGSVALAYNAIGIPICLALIAHRKHNHAQVLELLGGVRHDLGLMGGSHAQRDVFYHLLVHTAENLNRQDLRAIYLRDIERLGFCEVPSRAAYQAVAH